MVAAAADQRRHPGHRRRRRRSSTSARASASSRSPPRRSRSPGRLVVGQLPLREPAARRRVQRRRSAAAAQPGLRLRELRHRPVQPPAARRVASPSASSPGKAYNPLFIHGGVGLGKTHLLQAVCQKVLERQPRRAHPLPVVRQLHQPVHQRRRDRRHEPVPPPLPQRGRAGHRRHPLPRRPRPHAGRVLPHVQHALPAAQADHPVAPTARRAKSPSSKSGWSAASTGAWSRGSKSRATRRASRSCRRRPRMRGLTLPDDVVCYIAAQGREQHARAGRRDHQDPGHGDAPGGPDRPRPGQGRPGRDARRPSRSGSRSSRSSTPSRSTTTCG